MKHWIIFSTGPFLKSHLSKLWMRKNQRPKHRLTFLALWNPCWVASWCASSCASPRSWTRRWSVVTPCAGCVESSSAFSSTIHPAAVPCRGDPRIVSGCRQSARLPACRACAWGWNDQYTGCSSREKRVKRRRRMRECGGGGRIKASPRSQMVRPLEVGWSRSRWEVRVGGRCVEQKLHPQLSISPPPPPLLSFVIHLPYSLGHAVLVTLYQWAPAGVTLRFLPGWSRRHFSAPWRISLNLTPWCWNTQIHPPKSRCGDLLKVLPPK